MDTLLRWYALAVGASVGSFVGVVVSRLPQLRSVVRPPSACDACGRRLRLWHNLPILSYLYLRGRCGYCRAAIGLRALWVELAMGGLYVALLQRFGPGYELLVWAPLAAVLLAVALLDVDHWWVPDQLTYPAAAWALATSLLPGRLGALQAALGLLPAALLWAFAAGYSRLSGKESMGMGDIKLLAVVGLALGPMLSLSVVTLAALQGALAGSLILAVGGHPGPKPEAEAPLALAGDDWQPAAGAVPFGPFLVLACFEVVLLPQYCANWHLQLAEVLTDWLAGLT